MKKFAILLIASLAINYSLSVACTNALAANNIFTARINAIEAASYSADPQIDSTAEACGTGSKLCCVIANTRTQVQTQITKIKDAIKTFGDKVMNVGKEWAKVNSLISSSAITGTTTAAAALEAATTTEASGATGAQFKAFATYTVDAFKTDFTNFQGQAIGCLAYYSDAIQRIACDGCKDVTVPNRWKHATITGIWVNNAGAEKWTEACNKVWYFMWKVGWFTQAVAFLNNKKSNTYTYTAPAAAAVYFNQGSVTIETINTAFASCYPDASATVTACTGTMKQNLAKAFVQVWGTDTRGVGRSDTTILGGTTSFASNGSARRILLATLDGTLNVDNTDGLDVSTGDAKFQPTAAVAISTTERDAWSHGYVSSSSSTSGSGSTTTSSSSKNAKVLFGTLLSFLAVALLN